MIITDYRSRNHFGEETIVSDAEILEEYSPINISPETDFLPDAWTILDDALSNNRELTAWQYCQHYHARIDVGAYGNKYYLHYEDSSLHNALAVVAMQYALGIDIGGKQHGVKIKSITGPTESADDELCSDIEQKLRPDDDVSIEATQTQDFPTRIISCTLDSVKDEPEAAEVSEVDLIVSFFHRYGQGETLAEAIHTTLDNYDEIDNLEVYGEFESDE